MSCSDRVLLKIGVYAVRARTVDNLGVRGRGAYCDYVARSERATNARAKRAHLERKTNDAFRTRHLLNTQTARAPYGAGRFLFGLLSYP